MGKKQNLEQILKFLQEAEKLKSVLRHSWLSSGRQESVAEHSWRVALLAVLLAPQLDHKIDIGTVLKMMTIHDLCEIYAGDHHAWRGKLKNKHTKEKAALEKLVKDLPKIQKQEILNLWHNYEDAKTPEGKFAKAVDKLETIDQHNLADIKTWVKEEYKYQFEHGEAQSRYSKILLQFKRLIDTQTRAKISKK